MKLVVLFGIIVGFLLFRFLKKKVFSNTVKFSYSVISFLLCSIVGILSVYVVLNLLAIFALPVLLIAVIFIVRKLKT